MTQEKTNKYIRKPEHAKLYNNLYLVDYLENDGHEWFRKTETFKKYQDDLECLLMKHLIKVTKFKKNDDIDVIFADMIEHKRYYAFDVFEKRERETALKAMQEIEDKKHSEKIEKLLQMQILTKLKHKKIYIDNSRMQNQALELDFIFLDNSSSLTSIRKKIKYIDILMFELNNYALTDEKISIKAHIKIITKNEENKLRLSKQIKKIENDFITKRNKLIEASRLDKMQLLNIRLNFNATFYISSIEVKTYDTERFFKTESDKIKHHKISNFEIITAEQMLKKIEKNREDKKQKEIEKNVSEAARNILDLIK